MHGMIGLIFKSPQFPQLPAVGGTGTFLIKNAWPNPCVYAKLSSIFRVHTEQRQDPTQLVRCLRMDFMKCWVLVPAKRRLDTIQPSGLVQYKHEITYYRGELALLSKRPCLQGPLESHWKT